MSSCTTRHSTTTLPELIAWISTRSPAPTWRWSWWRVVVDAGVGVGGLVGWRASTFQLVIMSRRKRNTTPGTYGVEECLLVLLREGGHVVIMELDLEGG